MKDNKEKVLKSLFERPGYHFHLRELAREVGIHPNTTSVVINSLHKEKVVIKEPYKGVVKIYCDLESVNFKRKKQLWNLARLYDSGLIDELILKYNHPKTIILFGSFGRGEDFSSSDIDLAIFSSEQKKLDLTKYEKNFLGLFI